MLSTYAAKYRSLKAPRKLQWKPNLGTVQLELAIGDQTLEFNVSGAREARGWLGPPSRHLPLLRCLLLHSLRLLQLQLETPTSPAREASALPRRCRPSTPLCSCTSTPAPSGRLQSWRSRWGWPPTRCAARSSSGSTKASQGQMQTRVWG